MIETGPPASIRQALARSDNGAEPPTAGAFPAEHRALLAALARLGDAVAVLEGGRIVWAGETFVKLTGYSVAELCVPGVDAGEIILHDDTAAPWSSHDLVLIKRKDGRVVHAEVAAERIAGTLPERHVLVFRDATARQASERSLREQRDIYDALLQAQNDLNEGVVLLRASRIEYANETFARISGRRLPDLLGTDLDVSTLLAHGETARLTKDFGHPLPRRESHHYTTIIERPDGTQADVEIAGTDVVIRGAPYRLLLVRDITQAKRNAEELDAAHLRLAMTEKLAALGSLVSGVAHEVRTPLTVIESSAHVLEMTSRQARATGDYTRLAELAPTITESISSSIERANNLVKELRRFTQQQATARARVRFQPTVREAVELFQAANRSRVNLAVRLDPTPDVMANPLHVQQIVLNLLDNAADASRGGRAVRVRTERSADGRGAILVVEDEGVGISNETKSRMFEPLFTTKASGTGLGLAIVKRIVDEHGASIECDSAPGKGTTMRVRFPAADAA